jgi:glutamate dehydrogenase (NADP+)
VASLGPLFDRQPKYAWIMKQLLEPERTITFRVAWIDDAGISRVNRLGLGLGLGLGLELG